MADKLPAVDGEEETYRNKGSKGINKTTLSSVV